MENTRMDADLLRYHQALIGKQQIETEDIQCLLDAYREKFDVDLVFVAERLLEDGHLTELKQVSCTREYGTYLRERYHGVAVIDEGYLRFDGDGLSAHDGSDGKMAVVHYGVFHNEEYIGSVGMLNSCGKHEWSREERLALLRLGRMLKSDMHLNRVIKMRVSDQDTIDQQSRALEAFFATTDCGILCHTLDGSKVLSVNQAALQLLGYETREELEENFQMIAFSMVEEDRKRVKAAIRQLKKDGDWVNVGYRVCQKDGEIVDIICGIKLTEKNGELICQRVLMDCTEQRLNYKNDLEKKEKYWNEVTAALSMDYSSTFYLDVDEGTGMACRMTDRIKQAFPMLSQASIPHGEIQRLYAQNYVHPDDRDAFIETTSLENIRRELKDKVCFYTNYRTFDGQGEKYFRVKVVRVGDWKKQHGVMVGFRDIDSEIRKERVQLEMLEDALKQAAAASQAKSSFLSNMSHDIRTPMNAILGYTALAKRHIVDRERVQDYLDKIQTSGNHLLGLINDVLDMSRIESGKLSIDPETCSLKKIMDDLKTVMIGQIHEKQLDFCMDVEQIRDENVLCDKLRLNQVLLNILGNAVKYTPDGGEIAVWLTQKPEAKKEGCAAYRFRVKDNGIGMSEEFQTKLFEQFSREHNSTVSGIQGTGLGMAITKRIVDMMDGKISVKSKLGEGSEFIVDLEFPVAQAQKPQPEITGFVVEQAPVCQKLLLVEDNPLNQEIAKEILSEYGFEIEVANNGREAVEMVSQARPGRYDAVLMDIQMPVMNGYEATREIRGLEDKAQAQIPIIAMTANAFDEDRRNALNAGMNEFITKPVDVEKLLGILLR